MARFKCGNRDCKFHTNDDLCMENKMNLDEKVYYDKNNKSYMVSFRCITTNVKHIPVEEPINEPIERPFTDIMEYIEV